MTEQTLVGVIEDTNIKTGETNGKQWKRASIKLGNKIFSSFDSGVVNDILNGVLRKGVAIEMGYTVKDKFNTITSILPAELSNQPIKPVSESSSKEVDWDQVARGKIRSLLLQARVSKVGLTRLTDEEILTLDELVEIAMGQEEKNIGEEYEEEPI